MRNLVLDETEFKKEVEVVKEERRTRTDDDPVALTYEHFNALAYTSSTYGQPIIGWMDDLNNMNIQHMRDWYATWYAPNNATLVVAGDVQPDAVFNLAQKYFGVLKPSQLTPQRPRAEVPQQGERRLVVKAPAEVPYLIMGYKVPVLKTAAEPWEAYALDVLAGVLDGGNSSRLASELIRGQSIASSASAGYSLSARQESLFMLDASPTGETTIAQLETALREQIAKIQNQPPSQSEMERVKAQVMASNVYEQDSVFYQAMALGTLETVGLGWQKEAEYLKNIQGVTAEQVEIVHPKNDWVKSLTVADLKKMWEPAAQGKVMKWKDVRPEWPDAKMKLFGHRADSGTFDYFTEAVNGKAKASRGDFTASEDDNVLVQGVSGEKNSLGYLGLAYYDENKGKLKVVPVINPSGKEITPSLQTVMDGTYAPLSRPLFIYVSKKSLDKPEVKEFVEFYLKNAAKVTKPDNNPVRFQLRCCSGPFERLQPWLSPNRRTGQARYPQQTRTF